MADSISSHNELLESLRKQVDQKELEEQSKLVIDRNASSIAKDQRRLKELVDTNSTLPVKISSIQVIGAKNTRQSFLNGLLNPIDKGKKNIPLTLSEALREVQTVANKLSRFGIYHPQILTHIDCSEKPYPTSTPIPINIYFKTQERGRISLKTGTDLGNAEGSAYGNLTWRNVFGGAESLNLNASTGTRTRSAYQATFDTPILSDPDKKIGIDIFTSSTSKPWASHEEVNKGVGARYNWVSKNGARHQIGYTGLWRQVTGLATDASRTVRHDAGDSVKSSISHIWTSDNRDHPLQPTRGYLLRSISEIAGWGPLQGDVAFCKTEFESTFTLPLRILGLKDDCGISFSNGFRAGVLYPLSVGFGKETVPSRINDRFLLGGPTDVRGFKISGLGPVDGRDSVGGDVYAATSANLLMPFPNTSKDSPLRFQIFANAGRLLALSGERSKETSQSSNRQNLLNTISELKTGFPSLAAGVGVVYLHPVARFELNFCLPLILRKGEESRKGLQFGVGINFL